MANRKRNKEILFMVTDEEKEIIKKKAEVVKKKQSDYIREVALKGVIIQYDFKNIESLIYEINKIGTNVNQIAKFVNEKNYVTDYDTKNVEKDIKKVYDLLSKFVERL